MFSFFSLYVLVLIEDSSSGDWNIILCVAKCFRQSIEENNNISVSFMLWALVSGLLVLSNVSEWWKTTISYKIHLNAHIHVLIYIEMNLILYFAAGPTQKLFLKILQKLLTKHSFVFALFMSWLICLVLLIYFFFLRVFLLLCKCFCFFSSHFFREFLVYSLHFIIIFVLLFILLRTH